MNYQVLDITGEKRGEVFLEDSIFSIEPRYDIIHEVLRWQMAKRRSGNHSTKTVADVEGSTRKIYRQKGTGGARHGSNRRAQFRGGAIIFGPHKRDHEFSLNKKLRKLSLKMSLSHYLKEGRLFIIDDFAPLGDSYSSSGVKRKISFFGSDVLIVDSFFDHKLCKSVANLHKTDLIKVEGLNVLDIVRHEKLLISLSSLEKIEQRLK
ncbi:50S ribosomal protein L4 [Candidatus Cyrtobacter comes]|uniref:Large ribosomal subunit protein uL4 n=1 Tax=Candidatus Cyrtobacter comes TaxID=675776 RepID=A0ABU5L6I1_9RICK|nr:50S ribosomal protein L4 [Candidatus Cyrtobacter comes]MDZ5761723.1 50S ribosomal protein L4 [Candidatus Cyrtobacter comes]